MGNLSVYWFNCRSWAADHYLAGIAHAGLIAAFSVSGFGYARSGKDAMSMLMRLSLGDSAGGWGLEPQLSQLDPTL